MEGPEGAKRVFTILPDPADPNVLYVGTGGTGVFKVMLTDPPSWIDNRLWNLYD